jgi:DNA repair exonuclease SbcCD ATPase subunit
MDRLEKAMSRVLETQAIMQNQTSLFQNQMTAFQNQMTAFQNQMTKLAERQLDLDKRWFEIKEEQVKHRDELNQVIRILNEHTVLLENLPNAIKDKIGFKSS